MIFFFEKMPHLNSSRRGESKYAMEFSTRHSQSGQNCKRKLAENFTARSLQLKMSQKSRLGCFSKQKRKRRFKEKLGRVRKMGKGKRLPQKNESSKHAIYPPAQPSETPLEIQLKSSLSCRLQCCRVLFFDFPLSLE